MAEVTGNPVDTFVVPSTVTRSMACPTNGELSDLLKLYRLTITHLYCYEDSDDRLDELLELSSISSPIGCLTIVPSDVRRTLLVLLYIAVI